MWLLALAPFLNRLSSLPWDWSLDCPSCWPKPKAARSSNGSKREPTVSLIRTAWVTNIKSWPFSMALELKEMSILSVLSLLPVTLPLSHRNDKINKHMHLQSSQVERRSVYQHLQPLLQLVNPSLYGLPVLRNTCRCFSNALLDARNNRL